MVKFWLKRIKGDSNRIEEVPELWRDQVREMIGSSHVKARS